MDAISKKALLEWIDISIEGVPCKHVSIELLRENLQSGRFDLPSPAEGDTPQPIRDATEEEKFIRRITCSNDTLRGQLRESKAAEGRYRDALEQTLYALKRVISGQRVLSLDEIIALAESTLSLSPIGEQISLRPEVQWFAEQMELKLRANDHKGGWQQCHRDYLIERLFQEGNELWREIKRVNQERFIPKAADVANFAMMIADNARRLIGEQKEDKGLSSSPRICEILGVKVGEPFYIFNRRYEVMWNGHILRDKNSPLSLHDDIMDAIHDPSLIKRTTGLEESPDAQ